MGIKDIINYLLKLVIQAYIGGVFAFILLSVGSENENYFWEAFSPLNWWKKISIDNSFLLIFGLIIIFFISFNYLLKTKVDYWSGRWWYGATQWWWDDWF